MYELKDYLKAINESKENLLDTPDPTWEKKYPPFVINRCLSMFYDRQRLITNGGYFFSQVGSGVSNKFSFDSLIALR